MKFKINQVIFNNAIQTVSKIASTKTVMKTQNAVLLIAKDQMIRLIACDGKNKIETAVEANVEIEGKMLLPHHYLMDLIKKMPVSEIGFSSEDSGNIVITSGKSKYKLMSIADEEYQLIEMETEGNPISLDAAELSRAIDQVKFAVSKDENRLILTGVLFEFKNSILKLVAIDGYRMTSKTMAIDSDLNTNIVVTERALSEIQRLISSESVKRIQMYISQKMIEVIIGNTSLITSLINGEFIHYENILPKEFKSEILTGKTEFENAVDRTTVIISANQNKVIKLKISDDILQITTDSESGDAHEEIAIRLEGEDQYIGFNPRFILDALKAIEGEALKIKFTSAKGPCILSSVEKEDYFCLLLPCTI